MKAAIRVISDRGYGQSADWMESSAMNNTRPD
jgi:hypothetical protein